MTLGQMYEVDDAVDYVRDTLKISTMTARILVGARRRGELVGTMFGQRYYYAERDLNAWVAGQYRHAQAQAARTREAG